MSELLQLICGRPLVLADQQWRSLLEFADRTQSTTLLSKAEGAPLWVREAVAERIQKVRERRRTLLQTYQEATEALRLHEVPFTLLKGFTHEADAGWSPGLRVQNDIDLMCAKADIPRAEAALLGCGFVFHAGSELSDNHGRPLLKPHAWTWRDDFFDPHLPVSIELHHTIWSFQRDRIETPGVHDFWDRRVPFEGDWAFQDVDRLCIAALHLLRHILRNNVRPAQAYELARMAVRRKDDHEFWKRWQQHPARLRALQSVAMRLACTWFDEALPSAVEVEWCTLSPRIHRWFTQNAFAPMENLHTPNKEVLWLHMALLDNWGDRLSVARRRLLPARLPATQQAPDGYAAHLRARGRYHAVAFARMAWRTLRPATSRSTASQTSD